MVKDKTYEELVDENTALATHVERMSDIIRYAHRRGAAVPQWLNAHLVAWQQDKPATSLTRLKAEWQAESLEEALEAVVIELGPLSGYRSASIMASKAAELRRQAEGGE